MQVTKQLVLASGHLIQFFVCCDKRPSSGEWLTAVSALWKEYDTSTTAMRLRHAAVWNVAEVTLTVHHLNTAFWEQNKWKLGEIP
jgi:hypothetical protein